MEVTKCLKPPDSGHELGDCASVQAATRVNVLEKDDVQADPTVESGKADMDGRRLSEEYAHLLHRGSGGSMYTREAHATRETPRRDQGWSTGRP